MLHRVVPLVFAFLLAADLAADVPGRTPRQPAFVFSRETARAATPEEITQLNDVLHKVANDYHRWAYTERRIMRDERGRLKSDVLLRFDPSKPYAEQWTPLQINGAPPTERERAKYRRRGESTGPGENGALHRDDPRRKSLGELIDVGRSRVAGETESHLVFEVPLLKVGNERFPPDKFLVLARIRKDGAVLENISVRLRDSFRSKLVIKVKSGEGSLDFAVVDQRHPPALVGIEGGAVASVLFVSVGGSLELSRTELKHVRPFDERFDVQIGTLKAIDF